MSKKPNKREVKPAGYRVDQLATVIQTSRSKIYKMMEEGRLPYVDIGGRRLITNETVEELLATGENRT